MESESLERHFFLNLAYEFRNAFNGFRKDIIRPFELPKEYSDFFAVWHGMEGGTEERCARAIQHWIANHQFPELDDDVAYFLVRRFDEACELLKDLVIFNYTSAFTITSPTADDFARWMLVDWWRSHGIRKAYLADHNLYEGEWD